VGISLIIVMSDRIYRLVIIFEFQDRVDGGHEIAETIRYVKVVIL